MSSAYPRSSSPTREREKKSRLSRLLGGKREKTPEPTNDTAHDSAYGSSEPTSSEAVPTFIPENERHGGEMVPAEKNSEVANIDQHRNLAMKPSTGEVFDEDTGEVVTVVTTTVRILQYLSPGRPSAVPHSFSESILTSGCRRPLQLRQPRKRGRSTKMSMKMSNETCNLVQDLRLISWRCQQVQGPRNRAIIRQWLPLRALITKRARR